METIFLEFNPLTHNEDTYSWIESLIAEYILEVKKRGGNAKIVSDRIHGYDDIILLVQEDNAFNYFKERLGKQRIRIPDKETGRQQSISMEVALYPEAPEDFELKPKEFYCSFINSQEGRLQRVSREDFYVELKHKVTGVTVTCGEEAGRLRNKEMAELLLKAKLFKLQEQNNE